MDQFIIFLLALVGEGFSLKNEEHKPEEHVQIWFVENVICNDKKNILTNQFEVRRYLVKFIKSKNE